MQKGIWAPLSSVITARDPGEGSGVGVEGKGKESGKHKAVIAGAQNPLCKQRQAPSTAKAMKFQLPGNDVHRMHEAGEMQTSFSP